MAQPSFFCYNPEMSAESRQHALFTPHPGTVLPSLHMQHLRQQTCGQEALASQTLLNERPLSAGSQTLMPSALHMQPSIVPIISPRPIYHKPATIFAEGRPLAVDTQCFENDGYVYPATPPLSVSGSAISSPPMHSAILPTPTNAVFFGENIEGVKQGCEGEVKYEILAGEDWARAGSPPLTPGKFFPKEFMLQTIRFDVCCNGNPKHNSLVAHLGLGDPGRQICRKICSLAA